MILIKVENLHYSYVGKYQTVHALKGIDCIFEPAKFYAVTGASGSGKTTLLSLLAGLDSPKKGKIYVEGIDLDTIDKDRYRRESVSVIYQGYNLFPLLNALENVMYPMRLNKMSREEAEKRAKESLEKVGLGEKVYQQYPQMMSGGEQQRVAIARAVAAGGKILLADEPTGNLDSKSEENILKILKLLVDEEGYLVIVITHNPVIARAADVHYQMADGVLSRC